jgi:hypothetical protein
MKKQKTTKAWVYLKSLKPIEWTWFCFPFLNVKMEGTTKTPSGARRAAKRTVKRIGHKAEVKILWPRFKEPRIN